MPFILIVLLVSVGIQAKELRNCVKEESESLWVENYECENGKAQVGHGVITSSVVTTTEPNRTQIVFDSTKKNAVNLKYLKTLRKLASEEKD